MGYASHHEVGHLLVVQHVPDSVAGKDDELPVGVDFTDLDFRAARDDLVFRSLVGVGLECEVTEGSRERQVAVDPVDLHEATGLLDSLLLVLVRRLVIDAECDRGAVDASDAAEKLLKALIEGAHNSFFLTIVKFIKYNLKMYQEKGKINPKRGRKRAIKRIFEMLHKQGNPNRPIERVRHLIQGKQVA